MASFKVSITLEESDAAYFRNLYKAAKKQASRQDPQQIIREALALVKVVQESKKVPKFVADAVSTWAARADAVAVGAIARVPALA